MVNQKSLDNLRKGNKGNKGNKTAKGKTGRKTWADLIREFGDTACDLTDRTAGKLLYPGKTWQEALVDAAYKQAMLGNASILKEIWQRSEPQDNFDWLLKLDLDKLPSSVIEKIANANDIRAVILALASAGEIGATQ